MNPLQTGVPDRQRSIYEIVKQRQPEIFLNDKTTVPGQLRCEVSLQNTLNSVTFSVLENQGSQNVTERRLKITDNFIITAIGFFLMKAGTTTTATQAQISTAILHTFPNSNTGYFAGSSEAANLMSVYNGKWRVLVNNKLFIDDNLMSTFYRVPVSQGAVLGGTGGTAIPADGYDNMNYGFIPVTPTIAFSGIGKNEVTVNLPAATNTGGTSSQNFLVMICNGFNVLGANAGRV